MQRPPGLWCYSMRVLVIEDDRDIAANLGDFLGGLGHVVELAADGITGMHRAVTDDYDVILLDLNLPGMDGLLISEKLRQEAGKDTPILMLTARDTVEDKLTGFEHGADDYLVKPFSLREVAARMEALHKRHVGNVAHRVWQIQGLEFDPRSMKVARQGQSIKLSRKCLQLLEVLIQQPGKVFSRDELEIAVWGDTLDNSDTLRSHMHTLRKAINMPGTSELVENVRGLGYRLEKSDDTAT